MRTAAPRLIEFFSLPGAGKTKLARAMAAELPLITRSALSESWARQSPVGKCGQILRGLGEPRTAASAAQLAASARLANRESLFRLGRMMAKRSWLRSQDRTILLDQGHMQELWSIFYAAGQYSPPHHRLSDLIARLYDGMEVRLVYLDLDAEAASRRIANRRHGDSRLDGLGEQEIASRLYASAELPQALLAAAGSAGLAVTRLDANRPLSERVEELRPLVRPGLE